MISPRLSININININIDLTEVVHPLELLSDRHCAGRLHRDNHPDCVAKEVPGRLE